MPHSTSNQPADASTLVENAIVRPDEPRHFMVVEPIEGAIIAKIGSTVLARSSRALRVREVGRRIYEPVIYFPPEDVEASALKPTDVVTTCPLKGEAVAFDVVADELVERGAWSYQHTFDFDPRIAQLECCVAFDSSRVSVEPLTDA